MLQEYLILFYPEYMWLQELKFAKDGDHYINPQLVKM